LALEKINRFISGAEEVEGQLREQLLVEAVSMRGLVYLRLCRFAEAERDLGQALRVSCFHLPSLRRLYALNLKTGRLEDALRVYRTLVSFYPEELADEELLGQLEDLLEDEPLARKDSIRAGLRELLCGEEEGSFQFCRSIEKASTNTKSQKKLVDFGQDRMFEYVKSEQELARVPLPTISLEENRRENITLEKLLK
jgi:tetratricopeptide (TPR) repeat protein